MKKYFIGLASSLILLTACDESRYDLENLVPDAYHSILYVDETEYTTLDLYDTEDESVTYTHTIKVVKSGSDPKSTATAQMRVLTQYDVDVDYSALDGTNYKILPSDCYKFLTPVLEFGTDTKVLEAKAELIPTKIKTLQDGEVQPDAKWVLPLEMYSETDSVNSGRCRAFVVVNPVKPASVGFMDTNPSAIDLILGEASPFTQNISIGLNTDNKWTINCGLEVAEDFVNMYNQENKTDYTLLGKECYSFEKSQVIPENTSTVDFEVSIDPTTLGLGGYILPIRISSVDKFKASTFVYPLVIKVAHKELDRTSWTAAASSFEDNDEHWTGNPIARTAQCVLDDDLSTFWHSKWTFTHESLPFYLVIDTQKDHEFSKIEMLQRFYNSEGDTKNGIIYVTSTAINDIKNITTDIENSWTRAGSFSMLQNKEYQPFEFAPVTGRYVILKMTDSYRNVCSLSEVKVYGMEVAGEDPGTGEE